MPIAVDPLWQLVQRPGDTPWCLNGTPEAPVPAMEPGNAGRAFIRPGEMDVAAVAAADDAATMPVTGLA